MRSSTRLECCIEAGQRVPIPGLVSSFRQRSWFRQWMIRCPIMPYTRLPVLEPVPVIEQVRWGVDAIAPWLRAMRPRCTSFLPPVCIGLLDTGINLEHVAFSGASIVARSFIGSSDLEDVVGAGTHHAGLLVAQPESGNTGLCPDAILFAAKVCQPGQTFEQLE